MKKPAKKKHNTKPERSEEHRAKLSAALTRSWKKRRKEAKAATAAKAGKARKASARAAA